MPKGEDTRHHPSRRVGPSSAFAAYYASGRGRTPQPYSSSFAVNHLSTEAADAYVADREEHDQGN